MKKSIWTLVYRYIYEQRKKIVWFLTVATVFTVVLFLYGLPLGPILYAGTLCFFISLVFWGVDFWQYQNGLKKLEEIIKQLPYALEGMPETNKMAELQYQEAMEILYEYAKGVENHSNRKIVDLMDYYTLWVHQIKNPIAAMRLLLQTEESENTKELNVELFKIEEYVQMVLNYLRIDHEGSDFVFKEVDLDSIVKQALRKYAKLFILKKISLECSPLNIKVLTDEKWLVFVIEQILSNALKYTEKGKISIYLEGEKTLVIQDTGIGIEPEDLPRVFEKGYTGYNGRSYKKSTGIGLHLCQRIMTKLGHTISIESEVGNGTKVKLGLDTVKLEFE